MELQAKVIAASPKFLVLLRRLADYARHNPENLPDEVMAIANDADAIVTSIMGPAE